MEDFNELLGMLRNQSEDNPLPADFADKLESAHTSAFEPYNEKINQLEATNGELDGKVKEYAVKNFELMKSAPISQGNGGGNVIGSNETPERPLGVEELFKKAGF